MHPTKSIAKNTVPHSLPRRLQQITADRGPARQASSLHHFNTTQLQTPKYLKRCWAFSTYPDAALSWPYAGNKNRLASLPNLSSHLLSLIQPGCDKPNATHNQSSTSTAHSFAFANDLIYVSVFEACTLLADLCNVLFQTDSRQQGTLGLSTQHKLSLTFPDTTFLATKCNSR